MADLEKIFTGMDQGPEKINDNFDAIKNALATAGGNHKFDIQYYPLVTVNGWTTDAKNAFMKAENDQLKIVVVSFNLKKPAGVDFQGYMDVGTDPVVSSIYNGGLATAEDWTSGAMTNVLFINGKVQIETLTGNVFSNHFAKDQAVELRVDKSFIWSKQ